jgi:phosphatidylglycerophosphate synthase
VPSLYCKLRPNPLLILLDTLLFVFDERLRTVKVNVLAPLAKRYSEVHPLQFTNAAFAVGLLAAATAAVGNYWAALFFWLLNRLLDGLDGEVARLTGKQSDWGGYLDIVCDFLVYALVPFALAWSLHSPGAFFAVAFLLVTFYVNAGSWLYMSALLEKRRSHSDTSIPGKTLTSIQIPTGLIEGTETILFYSLFLLLPAYAPYLMVLMAFLVIITIFQRLSWAESQLQDE